MKNQVIKNLNPEMGKEIIEYWKSLYVDTGEHEGVMCEKDGNNCIYYGVINGVFDNYDLSQVTAANAEIIELPSKEPKRRDRVFVWDSNFDKACKRYFLAEIKGAEFPFVVVCKDYEDDFLANKTFETSHYKNMRPLQKKTVTQSEITKLGLEAYAKLHSTNVDNILIN